MKTSRIGLVYVLLVATVATAAGQTVKRRHMGPWTRTVRAEALPGGTLSPGAVPKYVTALTIPPVMPRSGVVKVKGGKNADYYEIVAREFRQQILPAGFPTTRVFGYGSANHPGTFNSPAFTIEGRVNQPIRVKWVNGLVDSSGGYRPHFLPVDQTLHWANPPGGLMGRDMHSDNPEPYTGPVPIITHVHGAHTTDDSDGYAESWFLPAAADIPAGYATVGTWYDTFKAKALARGGAPWTPGSATFDYPNDQRATQMWYHDHTLGMTRLNVYAGLAGFYFLRGGATDKSLGYRAPRRNDPPGTVYTELPIVVQDRSFNADGSLFFPAGRAFFDDFQGPYIPDSDISPIWNPEFFGNMVMVNGATWPDQAAQARRYRLRLLNGCGARTLMLQLAVDDTPGDGIDDGGWTAIPGAFVQIGTEGGFLPAPVTLTTVLMAPAERADVVVDFTAYAGRELYLVNLGPESPFQGGAPGVDFEPADPASTGQVMRFTVGASPASDPTRPAARLNLPRPPKLGAATATRQVSLNELDSDVLGDVGPRQALLGTVDLSDPSAPAGVPLRWMDEITENPAVSATEVWEIFNFTMDAHPIHLHLVTFEVIGREVFDPMMGTPGTVLPPEAWETGRKETVIAYPGWITRVKARFDMAGLYQWHCHIVDHEDNEMMRPYAIGPVPMPMRSATKRR